MGHQLSKVTFGKVYIKILMDTVSAIFFQMTDNRLNTA